MPNDCGLARCDMLIAVMFGTVCVAFGAFYVVSYSAKRAAAKVRAWSLARLDKTKGPVQLTTGPFAGAQDTLTLNLLVGKDGSADAIPMTVRISLWTLKSFLCAPDPEAVDGSGAGSGSASPRSPGSYRRRHTARTALFSHPPPSSRVDDVRLRATPHGLVCRFTQDVGRMQDVFTLVIEQEEGSHQMGPDGPGATTTNDPPTPSAAFVIHPVFRVRGYCERTSFYHYVVECSEVSGSAHVTKHNRASSGARHARAWKIFKDLHRQKALSTVLKLIPDKRPGE